MNKNLLILGAGQYGQVAKEIAESMGCFERISFLDDRFEGDINERSGIVGKLGEYKKFLMDYTHAFVAIGSSKMRLHYIGKLSKAGFRIATLVSLKAYVSPSAKLKNGVIVEPMAVVNANSTVEIGVFVCAGAIINHNCFIGEGCTMQCGSIVPANSKVPENIMLEYNVVYDGRFTEPIERRTPYGNNYTFEDGM